MLSLQGVELRPPAPDEFTLLTELRNRNRRWFGNPHALEPDSAAAWLATRHDEDRLLCIVTGGLIVGTIGWVRLPVPGRIYEMGRTIGDYRAAREAGCDAGQLRNAVRLAMHQALGHLFDACCADAVYARIRPENGLVRKVVGVFGCRTGPWPFPDPDPHLESWHLTRADWFTSRGRILSRINAHTRKAGTKDTGQAMP